MCTQKKCTRATITSLKKMHDLNINVKRAMKEREDNENGLDVIIAQIFLKYQIHPQSFHGGKMNGVCCMQLLNNIPDIMNIIKDINSKG